MKGFTSVIRVQVISKQNGKPNLKVKYLISIESGH